MTERTYRALLISNSTYPLDPHNLPELTGPRSDAAVMRSALCDPDSGLFAPEDVRLVAEREMSEIMREIEEFLTSATSRDVLFLYYSGHGKLDKYNRLHWCARDTRTDLLASSAVRASWVSDTLDQSAAGTTVIVLDCCHAGAFKGGDLPAAVAGTGRFVLSSVRGSELAADTDQKNGASVFTAALVDALQRDVTPPAGEDFVELGDVYHHVHDRMVAEKRGIPHHWFDGTGDVVIARRRHAPEPPQPVPPPEPPEPPQPPQPVPPPEPPEPEPEPVPPTPGWLRRCVDIFRRRRRVIIAAVGVLAVAVVVTAALLSRGGDDDGMHEVTVPGDERWTPTGVDIERGDTFIFRADGVVVHDLTTGDSSGPDGDDDPSLQQFNLPGVDGRHGALVGRLTPDQPPFVIGSQLTWQADGSGALELGVNDGGVTNNSGAFEVTFEHRPAE